MISQDNKNGGVQASENPVISDNNEQPDISHFMDHPPSPRAKPRAVAIVEEVAPPLSKTENRESQSQSLIPLSEKPKSEEQNNNLNQTMVNPAIDRQVKRGSRRALFVFALALILLVIGGVILYFQNQKVNRANVAISNQDQIQDTDGDLLPDTLETAVSLNPNIAEFTRCSSGENCANGPASLGQKQNLLIILDASSSMGLLLDGETKMDTAKQALISYLTQAEKYPHLQIGLAVYGNKGSDSEADKVTSCTSAEIVAEIGRLSSSTASNYLNLIEPIGWAPIGQALIQSQEIFADKEADSNHILIISDGAENCNTSPVKAAKNLYDSPQKIVVDVIGFGVTSSDATSLSEIATAGGGSFSQADSISSLTNIFQTKSDNLTKLESESTCNTAYLDTINQCIYETVKTLNNYAAQSAEDSTKTLDVINLFSKDMYDKLEELRNLMDMEVDSEKEGTN